MQHRVRDLLVRQRTQAINALRSHMGELGIVAARGYDGLKVLLAIIADASDARLPEDARASLSAIVAQLAACQEQIVAIEKRLLAHHRKNADSKGSRPSPASASSARVLLSPRFRMLRSSRRVATLRPGSASSRARIQPAASSDWVPSPSKATDICGVS